MKYEEVFGLLIENNFNLKKINGKQVAVYTSNNRIELFKEIEQLLPNAVYDETPTSKSSLGSILIGDVRILVKPLRLDDSMDKRGIENERILYNEIQYHTNPNPINILFQSEIKQYPILNCVKAELTGANTSDNKKADIVLEDALGMQHQFSIKQDNSDFWGSVDTYFGEEAERIIDRGVSKNLISLQDFDTYYSINPSISVKTTNREKQEIIFGSDIGDTGAVIVRSFEASDFQRIGQWLTINTTEIIRDIDDLNEHNDVYFLIRNDRTRKGIKKYPGIRSTAIPQKRLSKFMINIERN